MSYKSTDQNRHHQLKLAFSFSFEEKQKIKRCLRGSLIRERPQSHLSNSKLQTESNPIFHHLKKALKKMVPEYSQRDTMRGQGSGHWCQERELQSEVSLGS